MFVYILKRIFATIPVVLVVALFVFLLLRLSPGDPAAVIAGDYASPQDIENIRAQLGLNEPVYVQFVTWFSKILQGDLGVSIFSNLPVATLIEQRLEPTISLTVVTLVVTILISVPLGTLAAWKAGAWQDRVIMLFAVLGFSMPVFVFGYLLIYWFSIQLAWLPVQGYTPIAEGIWPWMRHLILPSVALAAIYIALITRITRASVMEILDEDYIRTARSKGVAEKRVLLYHALRNAAVPIVTIIGLGVALLIGGVVVTESVFNIPGVGRLVVDAILKRDYPIIQGLILAFAGVYILINLVIDILYTFLDPRIRY